MDIIYVHGLKVPCVIGVWEWERKIQQTLTIDLDMASDIRRSAASDALEDTLSYKEVAKRVTRFVVESNYKLVETLAEAIAELVRKEFQVSWCRVKINKFGAVRGAEDVGVIIERGSYKNNDL